MVKIATITVYRTGKNFVIMLGIGSIYRLSNVPYVVKNSPSDSYRIWNFVWGEDPDE